MIATLAVPTIYLAPTNVFDFVQHRCSCDAVDRVAQSQNAFVRRVSTIPRTLNKVIESMNDLVDSS